MNATKLPNTDHPEHHVRAWLTPGEAVLLDAVECPDLSADISVRVSLREDRDENGRTKRRKPFVENRRERESAASDLLDKRWSAYASIGPALVEIARLRRTIHYLRLGVDAPAVPDEVPS